MKHQPKNQKEIEAEGEVSEGWLWKIEAEVHIHSGNNFCIKPCTSRDEIMINERFNLNELLFYHFVLFFCILFYDVFFNIKIYEYYDFCVWFPFHIPLLEVFFFYNEKEQHNNNSEIKTNPCLIVKNIIITYKGITLKKKEPKKKEICSYICRYRNEMSKE